MPATGVLLVNLGTPASPRPADVRRYLREFLLDPHVIDIPAPLRWLLVEGTILPFRPRTSGRQYASIWTERGSPLLANSLDLRDALAAGLGDAFRVALGMRYGKPSIAGALAELDGCERAVVVPLFPQYAESATRTALQAVERAHARRGATPALEAIESFYDDRGFIDAWVEVARPELEAFRPDFVLQSFHGLPERQIRKLDATGAHCLAGADCCNAVGEANARCYRAHCFATARAVAAGLGLAPEQWGVAFQSRLGRTPWIRPFTDERLPELATAGVRRLAVLCPSFVADCLETLEEIGVRARTQWGECGGEALHLVPCLNAHPSWVKALAEIVEGAARGAR